MPDFIELSANAVAPAEENAEIITAFLSDFAFDTFDTDGSVIRAYAPEGSISAEDLAEIREILKPFVVGSISTRIIKKENWNELWEKNNFEPVVVANKVRLRAAFQQPDPSIPYDLVIQPKMSFGTGHHSTTQMMLELILNRENNMQNARVLDMGAGTGILAILAEKLGATDLVAIDIEEWAVENIQENALLNGCRHIEALCGDADFLRSVNGTFNIILANIQRSVLLQDAEVYIEKLTEGGQIFLSGFYEADLPVIREKYETLGCTYQQHVVLNDWCAAVFSR